jgi:hypothetical protein
MTMPDDRSPQPLQPGQFSLLGLLSFMLAWCIYFSTLATFVVTVTGLRPLPWRWLIPLTACVAWVALALLYRSWRLRRALAIHYKLPIAFLIMFFLLDGAEIIHSRSGWATVHAVVIMMFLAILWGVLVSLPIATLMLLGRLLRRGQDS